MVQPQPSRALNVEELNALVTKLARRLEQDINDWVKSKERRFIEIIPGLNGLIGQLEPRLRDVVRIIGVQGIEEYEIFKQSLLQEVRDWMEEVSVNHVAKMFEE